jgi:putative FmdB family regulatory protein
MPVYEYQCRKCGNKFELRRSLTDNDAEVKCPKCHTKAPSRIFSSFCTGPSTGSCAPSGGG